ncbi:MAG: hypothetical protein ACE5KZ_12335 [Candidatus Scalinduaceae bacterium]
MQGIAQDWRDILRGLKMAFDLNKLVSAFLGVVISIIWVLALLAVFSALGLITIGPLEIVSNVLIAPRLCLYKLFNVFLATIITTDWIEYIVLIILVLGFLVIWSVFGGSITRLAALDFAKGEKIGFKESISFALKKFWSYFWSPITPILGVLFFAACNILGGLFGQIKYVGEIAVAIGFPLAILSGFLIIFIGIIGIIGFFLMFPTVSAEGSDAFDAMSRAYSYVLSKPKHFISLFLGIIIYGVILTFFVSIVACLMMKTSFCTVGFGMGQKFESIRAVISGISTSTEGKATIASLGAWPMKFTAIMLMIYIAFVKMTIASIVFSFVGSASTVAYFLLRKDVDGTEINDVYIEEKEEVKAEEEKPEATGAEEKETTQEEKESNSEEPKESSSDESTEKE